VHRNRADDTQYKCGMTLVDAGNESLARGATKPVLAVPADHTWYVVPAEESVIILNDKGNFIYIGTHFDADWMYFRLH